jgi:hypothetical protein
MPIIIPACPGDKVIKYGGAPYVRASAYLLEQHFARAANYSVITPLRASGTKGAGALVLTLSAAAASGATTQGQRVLSPGFILEVGTSNNVSPGVSRIDVAGFFEDDSAYAHTGIELTQGRPGFSTYLVISKRDIEGGSYPQLIAVQNDFKVVLGGTSIALTAAAAPNDATAIVPTNGIQFPDRDLVVTVQTGAANTEYAVELLSPTSQYYNLALAHYYNSLAGGR